MKYLYQLFKHRFNEFLVRDYIHEIPDDVSDPAIKVMQEQARKLEKLYKFMAYELHRKMASDTRNTAQYQGMLLQLKILNNMITKVPDVIAAKPQPQQENIYDKAMAGVQEFVKTISTGRNSTSE